MTRATSLERENADGRDEETSTVHPGWFVPIVFDPEDDTPEDELVDIYQTFEQLLRTAGALDRLASDVLSDMGLTAGAFFALLELNRVGDEGIAPSALARRLAVARRTATLYVDILVRNGWVVRQPHPVDRRMVLARLTNEGKQVFESSARPHQDRLAKLLGDLSPLQSERLRQLLASIPLSANSDAEDA